MATVKEMITAHTSTVPEHLDQEHLHAVVRGMIRKSSSKVKAALRTQAMRQFDLNLADADYIVHGEGSIGDPKRKVSIMDVEVESALSVVINNIIKTAIRAVKDKS